MKPVLREEIVDYETYGENRDPFRQKIMAVKAVRRIHVGDHLTFLFENHDTILYQIQEIMRTERIVRETDILHEITTYNELLAGRGALGCTLLIEIETEAERNMRLKEWLPLPKHLYLRLENGQKIRADYDPRQVGDSRLSSVQYLQFDTGGQVPVAIGTDFDKLFLEVELSAEQKAALGRDLSD